MGWFSAKPKPTQLSLQMRDAIFESLKEKGSPSASETEVLAVAMEYFVNGGMDLVVAFTGEDGARYYNFSGAAVVWSLRGDLAPAIDRMLACGPSFSKLAGAWDGRAIPALRQGDVRLSVFTKRGWHFGQGPSKDLSQEPAANAIMSASFGLMQALMRKAPK